MKKSIVIFLFFITLGAKAQGNLQFNRVITFTAGSNYTVPVGKVLKIESIVTNETTICIPRTNVVNFECFFPNFGQGAYQYGTYDGITYLTIGNMNIKTLSANGFNQNCALSFNTDCRNVSVSNPQIQMPLWLEAGKSINVINVSTFQILISAIEFNVVQ